MDLIKLYFEGIPLPVLLLGPVVVIVGFVVTPARWRLPLLLALLVPWMATGRFTELGAARSFTKSTGFLYFLLIAVAAHLDPYPKRKPSPWVYGHVLLAVLGFAYIMTVSDRMLAMARQMQWLFLVLAAIGVSRTMVDQASIVRVLKPLAAGAIIVTFMSLVDLVMDPQGALRRGARFEPFGVISNQIGIVFAMAATLVMYFVVGAERSRAKQLGMVFIGLASILTLLTGSRSSMAALVLPAMPLFFRAFRRPILMLVGAGTVLAGVVIVQGSLERTRFERFTSLKSARFDIAGEYLSVIAQRPLTGLMTTHGESLLTDTDVGAHTHNAFLQLLYFGGVSYAAPMFVLMGVALWSAFRVWRERARTGLDPLLVAYLAAFFGFMYLHGFASGTIFFPTYAWAFWHILMACWFLTEWPALRAAGAQAEWDETPTDAYEPYDEAGWGRPGLVG
ncbi:MAG: O-antigen ligase domain-containing protein [Planctomycetota bacterium]|nr:MAG: O-antigen ligase domain-containing protein [Planctomycetota bacterium]